MKLGRRMLRDLARAWNRYPTLSGVLLGVALGDAWVAFAPPGTRFPLGDGWLLAISDGLILLVAVTARNEDKDD
jgi:hypothetical protein